MRASKNNKSIQLLKFLKILITKNNIKKSLDDILNFK